MRKIWIFLLIISSLLACSGKTDMIGLQAIPEKGWAENNPHEFIFSIDQPIKKACLLYQVSYSPEYEWENIWLSYCLTGPAGDTLYRSTDNLFLFEASGKPIGSGTTELLYLNAWFLKNASFTKPGSYRLKLSHKMRSDTIRHINSIGIRLQKVQ
jgi:gliding motility-associated lipoprotein GldH